jgi:hypothetical protein
MDLCIVDDSVEIPTRCSFVIEFIIPKFIEGSACFERQPLIIRSSKLYFTASGLYTHVVTGRCLDNVWGKLVPKRTKCCKQLSESPA